MRRGGGGQGGGDAYVGMCECACVCACMRGGAGRLKSYTNQEEECSYAHLVVTPLCTLSIVQQLFINNWRHCTV